MFAHRLLARVGLAVSLSLVAPAPGAAIAGAQMPEERPLTPAEAKERLAYFTDSYKNAYVHLKPSERVRLDSGVVVSIGTVRVAEDKLYVTGTLRNESGKPKPAGYYNMDLIESFEYQVAKYQKVQVRIGSCGGPCVNSYNPMGVSVGRLEPNQSYPFAVSSDGFARTFPGASASDMIVVINFIKH